MKSRATPNAWIVNAEGGILGPFVGSMRYQANSVGWQPTEAKGFWVKPLFKDLERGEKTLLMKVDPGAWSPMHTHPGELEQIYVLEGSFYDQDATMEPGTWCCRAPDAAHETGAGHSARAAGGPPDRAISQPIQQPFDFIGVPEPDFNPCYRRESFAACIPAQSNRFPVPRQLSRYYLRLPRSAADAGTVSWIAGTSRKCRAWGTRAVRRRDLPVCTGDPYGHQADRGPCPASHRGRAAGPGDGLVRHRPAPLLPAGQAAGQPGRPWPATYFVKYVAPDGRRRAIKVGNPRTMDLDEARAAARKLLGKVDTGGDPAAERAAAREAWTVREAVAAYRVKHGLRQKGAKGPLHRWPHLRQPHPPSHRGREDRHHRRAGGPSPAPQGRGRHAGQQPATQARRARHCPQGLRVLSTLLTWCVGEGQLKTNPIIGNLRLTGDGQRDVIMGTPEEYAPLYTILDDLVAEGAKPPLRPYVRAFVIIAALTGMRRGELQNLRWGHVDLEKRRLTLHGTKGVTLARSGPDRPKPSACHGARPRPWRPFGPRMRCPTSWSSSPCAASASASTATGTASARPRASGRAHLAWAAPLGRHRRRHRRLEPARNPEAAAPPQRRDHGEIHPPRRAPSPASRTALPRIWTQSRRRCRPSPRSHSRAPQRLGAASAGGGFHRWHVVMASRIDPL